MQSLNELRRKALDTLEDQILQKTRRKSSDAPKYMEKSVAADTKCNCFYVSVETSEQLLEVLKESSVQRIYLDCNLAERIWENPNLNDMIQSAVSYTHLDVYKRQCSDRWQTGYRAYRNGQRRWR